MRGFLLGTLVLAVVYVVLQPENAGRVAAGGNAVTGLMRRLLSSDVAGVPQRRGGGDIAGVGSTVGGLVGGAAAAGAAAAGGR